MKVNLKLPDSFKLPAKAVLAVDQNGVAIPQAEKDKAAEAAFAPALQQQFASIGQTAWTPPDCEVAVGPNAVVATVNDRWAIYSKCGTNLYEANIKTFVGDASSNKYFDPKVIFDIWSSRWFVLYLVINSTTHASSALLMYSDDSDPIGSWGWYYLDMTLDGGTATGWWADYPDLGADPNAVYVTVNMFDWSNPSNFQYAKIRALDKPDVLNGGGVCWWDFWNLHNPNDNSLAFSLRACDMGSWPGDMWFVNSVSYGASFLTLWKLTGATVCTGPALASFNQNVNVYDNPDAMLQPNATYLDCDDARLNSAVYYVGNIWTGHARRINWGEATDRSAICIFQLQPYALTVSFQTPFGASGLYYAYPAVNFDTNYNGIVAFARGGPTENPGSRYVDIANGGPWGGSSNPLVGGASSYTGSVSAGTLADPYRWGDYYGCARDPFDNRTLWMYGEYTVDAFDWGTRIGATAPQGAGALSVTPTGVVSGGLQGGPFSPSGVAYTVSNTGSSALTWTLGGVDGWNTPSATGGQLGPGGSTIVNVDLNAAANGFFPGTYVDNYSFSDCYSGIAYGRSTTLYVGTSGACDGSSLALTPNLPPPNFSADGLTFERGVFVTALKDFNLCSIGYKQQLSSLPRTLTARIYAATGTTRGALLASGSYAQTQLTNTVLYVPVSYALKACQDYEIVCVITAGDAWEWWNEGAIEPFDIGGAIRVRDGSLNGGASNTALPHFELIGSAAAAAQLSDLGGPGSPPNTSTNVGQERGIFIHALDTAQLCKFGWEADLPVGQKLTARVYAATGTTRGALLATGTYTATASGLRYHDVSLNFQLEEGKDYDLAVQFASTNSWPWWNENTLVEPYSKDVFSVVNAEFAGDASNVALPHYRALWDTKTGGSPFDLRKITDVSPPPNTTSQCCSDYGAYITSVINQQVYSLGWMADIPPGQPITANVYAATGLVRGALISSGTIYSSGAGMRWHDVPVAAEFHAGTDYDISLTWSGANQWRWWNDAPGLPYTINGVIQVRNSEAFGGNAGNSALINMRVFACSATLTPVAPDQPQHTPMFIAIPAPNPVTGTSRLNFALDEAGPVAIHVYDVAGRRVSTLYDGAQSKGWHSVDLNSDRMASGVYFLKMQTAGKALTRKFVVTH